METYINYTIIVHAILGGIGLLLGIMSMIVVKGSAKHKLFGKFFSYSILLCCLLSLIISSIPTHENTLLFLIGLFTIYLVLAGNNALTLTNKDKIEITFYDRLITGSMILVTFVMFGLGVYYYFLNNTFWLLFCFFGVLGTFLIRKDIIAYKSFRTNRKIGLINHIGRMIGALISSFTAFLVAGAQIKFLIVWFIPTLFGLPFIIYWVRKVK